MDSPQDKPEEGKERGLKTSTIVFMIVVAVFFDLLQWALVFIFMGWLAGIFAGLTFYVWFKTYGISFMKPKKALAMGGGFIIEMLPVISSLPAWTAAVTVITLDSKLKKVLPPSLAKTANVLEGKKPKTMDIVGNKDKIAA